MSRKEKLKQRLEKRRENLEFTALDPKITKWQATHKRASLLALNLLELLETSQKCGLLPKELRQQADQCIAASQLTIQAIEELQKLQFEDSTFSTELTLHWQAIATLTKDKELRVKALKRLGELRPSASTEDLFLKPRISDIKFKDDVSKDDEFHKLLFCAEAEASRKDFAQATSLYAKAEQIILTHPKKMNLKPSKKEKFYLAWARALQRQDKFEETSQCLLKGAEFGEQASLSLFLHCMQKLSQETIEKLLARARSLVNKKIKDKTLKEYAVLTILMSKTTTAKEKQRCLTTLAEIKTATAQIYLACELFHGDLIPRDLPRTLAIINKVLAEDKNDLRARNLLIAIYLTQRKTKEAIEELQSLASIGDDHASFLLSIFHELGLGVTIDSKLAEELYKQASLQSQSKEEQDSTQISTSTTSPAFYSLKLQFPLQYLMNTTENNDEKNYSLEDMKEIVEGLKKADLYASQEIRILFFNIRFASHENLVKIISKIGTLFHKMNYACANIIKTYVQEIEVLVDRLSEKAPTFGTREIALSLHGISKLQLNPEDKPVGRTIHLLLNYANQKLPACDPKDLSLLFSALVKLGLPLPTFKIYFGNFFNQIQKNWEKFTELSTLTILAYTLAIFAANQSKEQKSLPSKQFPFLENIFLKIKNTLNQPGTILSNTQSSQLDLAVRYFTQFYPKQHNRPSSNAFILKKYFTQYPNKIPPGHPSHFQLEVYQFIHQYRPELKSEEALNGLRADAYDQADRLVVDMDGPTHFLHSISGALPIRSPKDIFHKALLAGSKRERRVESIAYFEWDELKSPSARQQYCQKKSIIATSPLTLMPPPSRKGKSKLLTAASKTSTAGKPS